MHALTGSDTTSKIGAKKAALETAESNFGELLLCFAKESITLDMINQDERFLVQCCAPKSACKMFDELRYQIYHKQAFKFDLEKIPATSSSIVNHIKRAYYQCYLWINLPVFESPELDPLEYGYVMDDDFMVPDLKVEAIPDDFPMPCSCIKCARDNVCPCRVKNILCCNYCK